jgi:hypothetical protein
MTVIHENLEMLKLIYDTGGRLQLVPFKRKSHGNDIDLSFFS